MFHGGGDGAVAHGQGVVGSGEQVTNVMNMQVGVGVEVFEHGLVTDSRDGETAGLGKGFHLRTELGGYAYCYSFGDAVGLDGFHVDSLLMDMNHNIIVVGCARGCVMKAGLTFVMEKGQKFSFGGGNVTGLKT